MDNLIHFVIQHGYAVLFIWIFTETMGLPVPSAPLLVMVGALAGGGQMNLLLCISLGVCAALPSVIFWYSMGRQHGANVLSLICRISLEPDSCVRQTENIYTRFGAQALLVIIFLPGLSSVSTSLAGVIRMRLSRFLLFSCMVILIWVGTYTLIGYAFSEELERALAYVMGMGRMLFVLVVGGLMTYILRKYAVRRSLLRELSIERITPEELKEKLDGGEDIIIIDVRRALDFEAEPYIIPGAVRILFEQVESNPVVPNDREIVVYCTRPNEASSARVAILLRQRGIMRVRPLAGGFHSWRDHNYPVELVTRQEAEK
jgi:membrane protein DedA with SNARE-associated domain/rhodanese-related sulfurtransferase